MDQPHPTDSPEPAASGSSAEYLPAIRDAHDDPRQLEQIYQTARQTHAVNGFTAALLESYREAPGNLLYGAWYYRLQHSAQDSQHMWRGANWKLAVPVSVLLGLALWLLSDPRWTLAGGVPYLAILWAPITALCITGFLSLAARQRYQRAALAGVALALLTGYVLVMVARLEPARQMTYLTLMVAHLPLLAGSAVGLAVLGWGSAARERFAFLTKSIEAIGTAGVAVIAGGIFVALTYGMFLALSMDLPELVVRLLVAGGAGLIPVLAVATVYDPAASPSEQEFGRGFGKVLTILMRALLPLTLIVLVVYVCAIPFSFFAPFTNRDVLIVYNAMLFAIMGLLIGVTPLSAGDLPGRYGSWLRVGIIAVAGLVVLVSVYALAAIVYRTAQGQLTMNRLTVIGWNTINIGILVALLYRQLRPGGRSWVDGVQAAFRLGTVVYVVWAAFLTLALPWLF
jgi:hypothetical protein